MDKIFQTAGITAFAVLIVSAVIWAVINELNARYWKKQTSTVLLGVLGAVVLGSLFLTIFENPLKSAWRRAIGGSTSGSGDPVVVGIYPTDGFGPLHQSGLETGIDERSGLRIVSLTATTNDMKTRSAAARNLLDELRNTIVNRNVVAIVGPPVTEFTRPVIETVRDSGKKPPVFITSATPRHAAGWDEAGIPLFRINSGIDERAEEFVALTLRAVAAGLPLIFLIEQNTNSGDKLYGQLLWEEIYRRWSDAERQQWDDGRRGHRRYYNRGNIEALVAGDLDRTVLPNPGLVMLLGLGADYAKLVRAFYKQSDPPRRAMLGGWMSGYEVDGTFRNGSYQWDRLFEITDLGLRPRGSEQETRFLQRFHSISPAVRDQAFSFDAGRLVSATFQRLHTERGNPASIDKAFSGELARRLRAFQGHGVTGPIRFDEQGQNVGERGAAHDMMTYAQFDGTVWRPLRDPAELIAKAAAPAAPAAVSAAAAAREARPSRR